MADTVQQALRARLGQTGTAVVYGDRAWTWQEHLGRASAQAAALLTLADPNRPMHVGTVLGNTPDMLEAVAAAGLGGYVLCGINTTRRGDGLARDISRADCQIVVTDRQHRPLLDGLDLPGCGSSTRRRPSGRICSPAPAPASCARTARPRRWTRS